VLDFGNVCDNKQHMVNSNINATIPIFDVIPLKEDYDEVIHTCNEFCENRLLWCIYLLCCNNWLNIKHCNNIQMIFSTNCFTKIWIHIKDISQFENILNNNLGCCIIHMKQHIMHVGMIHFQQLWLLVGARDLRSPWFMF